MYRQADVKEIKEFFGTPDKPVGSSEMMEFWKSLTDDEKAFYKQGVGELLGLI